MCITRPASFYTLVTLNSNLNNDLINFNIYILAWLQLLFCFVNYYLLFNFYEKKVDMERVVEWSRTIPPRPAERSSPSASLWLGIRGLRTAPGRRPTAGRPHGSSFPDVPQTWKHVGYCGLCDNYHLSVCPRTTYQIKGH